VEPMHMDFIKDILYDFPIAYPREICNIVLQEFGVHYNERAMHQAMNAAGLTRKAIHIF
jgi:transposase